MASVLLFVAAALLFMRVGQEFIPTLDERNIAMQALRIPSTSLSQSQAMQISIERAILKFPQGRCPRLGVGPTSGSLFGSQISRTAP